MTRTISAALAGALVLAACGSATPGASDSKANAALGFSQCMRAHGVSDFPDPSSGGAISVNPSEVRSPAFQSAQQACRHLLPARGQPGHMTAGQHRAALRLAQCMRAHGEPDFPDPSGADASSKGLRMVLGGMSFAAGPGLNPSSPAFRQAAARCGVKLPTGPPHSVN